jgi:hypothetical protein
MLICGMIAIKSYGNGSSGFPALESNKVGMMVLVYNTSSIKSNGIVAYLCHARTVT